MHAQGYVLIYDESMPQHVKLEHRSVMEKIVGRQLGPDELVHHKNGDKKDNRPENLEIIDRATHCSLHHKGLPKPKRRFQGNDMRT